MRLLDEQAHHQLQSHVCILKPVKRTFKKEGNSIESLGRQPLQPLQEAKAPQDHGASSNSPVIHKTHDDQNMMSSNQHEAYYIINPLGNNYAYSSDSFRVLSTKPIELVYASPFGVCSAMDKEQNNSEKVVVVMPLGYRKTSEKKMRVIYYTNLLHSSYIDSLKFILDDDREYSNSREYHVKWKPSAGNQQNFVSLGSEEFREDDNPFV